jgi:hypothetical protein
MAAGSEKDTMLLKKQSYPLKLLELHFEAFLRNKKSCSCRCRKSALRKNDKHQ